MVPNSCRWVSSSSACNARNEDSVDSWITSCLGLARLSGVTAMASPPHTHLAPLSAKLRQRLRTKSLGRPSSSPSHPSMGWITNRLPQDLNPSSTGCAKGDSGARSTVSSAVIDRSSSAQRARNSSTEPILAMRG